MAPSLTEKILAALANSASTNYVDESIAFALGSKRAVKLALDDLLGKRAIVSCRITKGGHTSDVYWLACQLARIKRYSEVFTPEKRIELAASKKAKPPATDRCCRLCQTTKPLNAYKNGNTACDQCLKAVRLEKYKLAAKEKETIATRWCMACKQKHPATAFGNTRSRRCTASTLIHKQNERAILTQKNREWRARVKARQASAGG
jgi:hypothetical protein